MVNAWLPKQIAGMPLMQTGSIKFIETVKNLMTLME